MPSSVKLGALAGTSNTAGGSVGVLLGQASMRDNIKVLVAGGAALDKAGVECAGSSRLVATDGATTLLTGVRILTRCLGVVALLSLGLITAHPHVGGVVGVTGHGRELDGEGLGARIRSQADLGSRRAARRSLVGADDKVNT